MSLVTVIYICIVGYVSEKRMEQERSAWQTRTKKMESLDSANLDEEYYKLMEQRKRERTNPKA